MLIVFVQTSLFVLNVFWWIVILSSVFSWLYVFNIINKRNRFVILVNDSLIAITEPIFYRVRRFMPNLGSIDISPFVVLVIIYFLQHLVISLI